MAANIFKIWDAQRDRILALAKEGSWIMGGQIASVLGALVLVRVLTEYLDPVEYGELALGLTIAILVHQVVTGGIISGIGRFYSIAVEKNDLVGYLQSSKRLLVYATWVVILFVTVLSVCFLTIGLKHWIGLIIVVSIFSVLTSYNGAVNSVQNAARQRAVVALHGGIDSWLKIGLAMMIILWLGSSGISVVIGYSISTLLVTVSQFFILKRHASKQSAAFDNQNTKNWSNQIWQFSWPFSVWGVFTWGQLVSDRWALEIFSSTQDVGQYVVLFQLGYAPIAVVTGLLITFVGPILYQRSGAAQDQVRNENVHKMAWSVSLICLSGTALIFLFAWIFHAPVFQLLVASAYRNASQYLPWMVLAGGFFATGQMLSLKLISELRTKLLLYVKLATALIGLGLNFIGAWKFGISGVVGAAVIFSLVYMLWVGYISVNLHVRE